MKTNKAKNENKIDIVGEFKKYLVILDLEGWEIPYDKVIDKFEISFKKALAEQREEIRGVVIKERDRWNSVESGDNTAIEDVLSFILKQIENYGK